MFFYLCLTKLFNWNLDDLESFFVKSDPENAKFFTL